MVVLGTEASSQIPLAIPAAPSVAAPAGQAFCAECRRVLSTGDMVAFGEQWVCVDCKALFFQRIREGSQSTSVPQYAGFWIRFAAKLLDLLVIVFVWYVLRVCLAVLIGYLGPIVFMRYPRILVLTMIISMAILPMLVVVFVFYETLLIGWFGATFGKMACRLRVVRPDGSKVKYGRALARCCSEYISALPLYLGFITVAFDKQKRAYHDSICSTRVVRKG